MVISVRELMKVAEQLKSGAVGVMAFDTIWGICGLVRESLLDRICEVKGRSSEQGFVLVGKDLDSFSGMLAPLEEWQREVMAAYMPGPFTFILPCSSNVPDLATGGRPTLAVRVPDYVPLQWVLSAVGEPLISTSANVSGESVCVDSEGLDERIRSGVDFVCDEFGAYLDGASTIVDLSGREPKVLREGVRPFLG